MPYSPPYRRRRGSTVLDLHPPLAHPFARLRLSPRQRRRIPPQPHSGQQTQRMSRSHLPPEDTPANLWARLQSGWVGGTTKCPRGVVRGNSLPSDHTRRGSNRRDHPPPTTARPIPGKEMANLFDERSEKARADRTVLKRLLHTGCTRHRRGQPWTPRITEGPTSPLRHSIQLCSTITGFVAYGACREVTTSLPLLSTMECPPRGCSFGQLDAELQLT